MILAALTGTVMTVIGNNIALSLGMVGALSIVRFRTAIKDSRDTVYIFWSIIVGICCGVGDYLVAAVGSAVVFLITMVLAWFSGLINVRFMVLLFLIYVLFGVVLSLTAFFARMYTADLRVSFADMMKAVLLCFFEITCLRFVLTWVRATAFFGYRKSRLQWGSMKRKTINYN